MRDLQVVQRVPQAVDDSGCGVGQRPVQIEQRKIEPREIEPCEIEPREIERCVAGHRRNIPHASGEVALYAVPVPRPVEVIAHRGASDDEPEHTLAAYLAAVGQGADAIECDVRLTIDGTLVCVHDRRIDRTSTGRGPVSSKTLEELSVFDYSRSTDLWHDYESPPLDESRTAVLTLRTLLATMLDSSPTIRFSIETKHPTRYGGYVERVLVEQLRYFGLTRPTDDGVERARVMSFSRAACRRVVSFEPAIPTVMLMHRVPTKLRDGSLPRGVRIAGPSIDVLRAHPKYVAKVHAKGGLVHAWTVDKRTDVSLCLELGVDGIITNRPGRVAEMLAR